MFVSNNIVWKYLNLVLRLIKFSFKIGESSKEYWYLGDERVEDNVYYLLVWVNKRVCNVYRYLQKVVEKCEFRVRGGLVVLFVMCKIFSWIFCNFLEWREFEGYELVLLWICFWENIMVFCESLY